MIKYMDFKTVSVPQREPLMSYSVAPAHNDHTTGAVRWYDDAALSPHQASGQVSFAAVRDDAELAAS